MATNSTADLEIGLAISPGRKRRDEPNQDAVLAIPPDPTRGFPALFIVADGMGGHVGGSLASQTVVETIAAYYRQAQQIADLPALLQECLRLAHRALTEHSASHPELGSMGSTAVLASIQNGQVVTANVGDSRAYLLHDGKMLQLSQDHSVVAEQVRTGQLTPLQALRHPKRNQLTQSLTPRRKVIHPFVNQASFSEGDVVLLCTDGLWGGVSEAVLQAVAGELPPQQAADKLVEQAMSTGGPDNISVIVARQREAGQSKEPNLDDTNPGF